jgi:hypothetical protein
MVKATLKRIFPYFTILIGWFIFVFPSLIGSTWFYLDDPGGLLISKNIFKYFSWLLPDYVSGRYYPTYWLWKGIVYKIVGESPFGFYFFQSIILFISALLIFWITRLLTKETILGILSVFLFFSGSPIAENVFTFSKSEPLLLLLILFNLFIFLHYFYKNSSAKDLFYIIGSVCISVLSIWQKETAVVFIVFGVIGTVCAFLLKTSPSNNKTSKSFFIITLASIISFIITKLPFLIFRNPNPANSYINYPISLELIKTNFFYYINQQPDIFIIGLIAIILIVTRIKSVFQETSEHQFPFIVNVSLLVMSLCYILILLIWRWPLGYYMYIPSAFLNLIVGSMLIYQIQGSRLKHSLLIVILVIGLLVSKSYSLIYNYYVATTQRAQAQVYMESIEQYMKVANSGNRLLVEQWPFWIQSVFESNTLIKDIYKKKGLKVDGINDILNNIEITPEAAEIMGIKNIPKKETRWPKKGDFILVFTGEKLAYWHVRGVAPYYIPNKPLLLNRGFDLQLIASDKKINKVFYLDDTKRLKFGDIYTGYQLFQVNDVPHILWDGRYEDSWVGKKAKCNIYPESIKREFNFQLNVLKPCIPNKLEIFLNKRLIKTIEIVHEGTQVISIQSDGVKGKSIEIEFNLEKTFIPKNLGINNDTRELGAMIDIK